MSAAPRPAVREALLYFWHVTLLRPGRRPLHAWAWIVLALVALAPASAAAAVNPVLSGHVESPTTLSGAPAVAVAGEYAYATGYYAGKLAAIDIADPELPVLAGESTASGTLINASTVNVSGGYAYVVSKNRNGPEKEENNDDGTGNSLTILDIASHPASPEIVGSVHDSNVLFGAYGVAIAGNYAYVAAQGCLSGQPCANPAVGSSFAVIDISEKKSPSIVASLQDATLPAPWKEALHHATSVAISGNYAYVTAFYSDRLTVIDIAEPLHPAIVASINDATNLNFPADVAVSGHYAYVADQGKPGRLSVFDVSEPSNPHVVGTLVNAALNGGYRVRVHGDFAYVSASVGSDVAIVDISDPLAPRLAASVADGAHLNKTTGLDLDPSGRYLVASSPFLSTQKQTTFPPFALEAGGPELTGTVSVITLDPSPIEVSIAAASEPASQTTQTSASFAFSVNDAVSAVQCRLDAGSWLPCTTQTTQTYASLGVAPHTFEVRATGATGSASVAGYNWTVTAPASPTPTPVPESPPAGPAPPGSSTPPVTWTPTSTPTPTSSFALTRPPSVNTKTGAITFTVAVLDPGTLSWQLTFANGRFGAFAASRGKCKAGQIKLGNTCRAAQVTFAKGAITIVTAGTVSFAVKPSAFARAALTNTLKKGTALPLAALLKFQSAFGGSPVSLTRSVAVKLKGRRRG